MLENTFNEIQEEDYAKEIRNVKNSIIIRKIFSNILEKHNDNLNVIFENLNLIKSKYNMHLSEQEGNSAILMILKCLLSFTNITHEYDIISYYNPDEYALVLKNDNFSYKSVFKWSKEDEIYLVPITVFKIILADYYFNDDLDKTPINKIWSEEFDKVFNPFNSN